MLPKTKFKMATKTQFAYVAKKTLFALRLFWAGKKYKNYLEAPKLKMAARFKIVAKILFSFGSHLEFSGHYEFSFSATIFFIFFWGLFFKNMQAPRKRCQKKSQC
jgi:hypothetical protein